MTGGLKVSSSVPLYRPSFSSTRPSESSALPPSQRPPDSDVEFRGESRRTIQQGVRGIRKRRNSTITELGVDFTHTQPEKSVVDSMKECCGGGCCQAFTDSGTSSPTNALLELPHSDSFKALRIPLDLLTLNPGSSLKNVVPLPQKITRFEKSVKLKYQGDIEHPPAFVTPHPPFAVFSAPLIDARELTKPGAEKRTYHFDIDVTDYPQEDGTNWKVGGAVGVCAPICDALVEEVFDTLQIPLDLREEPVVLNTLGGRWPTVWGEEQPRSIETTRREILTWTVDIQSFQPKKTLLRVLAEYATNSTEKSMLLFLCSKQGQAAFCEIRSNGPVSLLQLLHAFPSSRPPFDHLLSVLQQLMPRFYSLSNDPCQTNSDRQILQLAVSIYESKENWRDNTIKGVCSGFFERTAIQSMMGGQCRIPIFRGLQMNPLAKEFSTDGPMILIGAGVGVAPFRGFVQRRLQQANCANKVWVIQGCRDSLVDEIYHGEWGGGSEDIRKVVQSRVGTKQYVQDEVLAQSDLVWSVINSPKGRVFVCGSTKGMGEGVEAALVKVAQEEGGMNMENALEYWKDKERIWQYIKETW